VFPSTKDNSEQKGIPVAVLKRMASHRIGDGYFSCHCQGQSLAEVHHRNHDYGKVTGCMKNKGDYRFGASDFVCSIFFIIEPYIMFSASTAASREAQISPEAST